MWKQLESQPNQASIPSDEYLVSMICVSVKGKNPPIGLRSGLDFVSTRGE